MSKKINFPTMLTIIRMVLVVPFLICLILGQQALASEEGCNCTGVCVGLCTHYITARYYWAAFAIFIIAALTDKIDGDYARKHNQVTDLGKFLDPLADKMLVDTAFLGLVMAGAVPVWMFAIIILRDLAVDGIRMLLAQKQIVLAASMWGKVKTATQMVTLAILMWNLILGNGSWDLVGEVLLYVVVVLTIISGLEIIVKGLKKLD